MPDYIDDPPDVLGPLRSICLSFPEAYEEPAWAGRRWRIRRRTFAHVRTIDGPDGPSSWLRFTSLSPERDALLALGHPYFPGGVGSSTLFAVLGPDTDWDEMGELLLESFLTVAPKKLAALAEARTGR